MPTLMNTPQIEPEYENDILKHLRYAGSIPLAMVKTRDYLEAVQQALSRAADEIERLRNAVELLKRENTRLKKGREVK